MTIFTASTADRVLACPSSLTLPQTKVPSSPAAAHGIAVHEFLHDYAVTGTWGTRIPDGVRIDRAAIDALLSRGECKPELVLSWDPETDTGKAHPGLSGRDYRSIPGVAGTADLVIFTSEGLEIWDYKTGRPGSVRESGQMLALAVAASRAYGVPKVTVGFAVIDTDTGAVELESYELDVFDLDWAVDRFRQAIAAIKGPPVFNEGYHCKYCPGFRACPAKLKTAREVLAIAEPNVAAMTPDVVGRLWLKSKDAQALLDTIAKSIREYVETQPLTLPGGGRVELRSIQATRKKTIQTGETETYSYKKLQVVK